MPVTPQTDHIGNTSGWTDIHRQKRRAAANKVLPQWGLTNKLQQLCYYGTLVLNSTDGFQNPPLRQYPNRWVQV